MIGRVRSDIIAFFSVADLRFRLPQPVPAYNQSFSATAFGPACPQQKIELPILQDVPAVIVDDVINGVFSALFPASEDCKWSLLSAVTRILF